MTEELTAEAIREHLLAHFERLHREADERREAGAQSAALDTYLRRFGPVPADFFISPDAYSGRGEELDAINEEIEAHRKRIVELGERRAKPLP